MAIDPMLYKKYNGRDSTDLVGSTLASNAEAKAGRAAAKDRTASERLAIGHLNAIYLKWAVGGVILIGLAIWRLVT